MLDLLERALLKPQRNLTGESEIAEKSHSEKGRLRRAVTTTQ